MCAVASEIYNTLMPVWRFHWSVGVRPLPLVLRLVLPPNLAFAQPIHAGQGRAVVALTFFYRSVQPARETGIIFQ